MDFKSYDLIIRYTDVNGKRVEEKWESVEQYLNKRNKGGYDVEAVIFGYTGKVHKFESTLQLVDFINRVLLGRKDKISNL